MSVDLQPPLPPMEAESVEDIPVGEQWQYEPKWDGFRCLVFRDQSKVSMQSKAGQPLARYFPELVEAVLSIKPEKFVLDTEIVIPVGDSLSFDCLLLRLHPAESRIRKLAAETPAMLVAFDLLADEKGKSLIDVPLELRRMKLEAFADKYFSVNRSLRLSQATTKLATARRWFKAAGASLDGIIAKRVDLPYQSGLRTGMQKIKPWHSIDCVVGGFRYASKSRVVGSLLLGLYDKAGLLHHVGFCSGLRSDEKKRLIPELEALISLPGFTGSAPGGPSRWATERTGDWQPLKPKLVVEVSYDHFTGGRFRHGTRLVRWRLDKAPEQCLMEQILPAGRGMLRFLE